MPAPVYKRTAEPDATSLHGYAIWLIDIGDDQTVSFRCDIQHAILRENGNELAIDCDRAQPGFDPFIYTIILRRESPLLFRGVWSAGKASERQTGTCSARIYSNGPQLALVGAWQEPDGPKQWLAELSPTDDQ